MDFVTLQSEVRTKLIDLPTAVTNLVPTYINRAIRDLQRKHNFKVMEKQSNLLITTLNTRLLATVPTDFKEYRSRPFVVNLQGDTAPISTSDDIEATTADYWTEIGLEADVSILRGPPRVILRTPPTDDLGTTDWHIYPLPDGLSLYADGEYRIIVPYFRYLPDLSANSDQNWFTNKCEEFIIFQACASGFFDDWDEERATTWTQRAGVKFQEALNLDKRLRVSGIDTLIPHADVYGARNTGRPSGLWRR